MNVNQVTKRKREKIYILLTFQNITFRQLRYKTEKFKKQTKIIEQLIPSMKFV